LAKNIREHSPQQFNFEFGLWTLLLIGSLIEHQFGKSLALSSISRTMKLLGFSAQKRLYRAWQQDVVLVRTWEQEIFPAIRREARASGAMVFFADESGLRSDYHTGTTWAQKDETPVVSATGRRFSFNMILAVSPRGDFRFMIHGGTVDSDVFITFLKRLLIGSEQPVFLIVDDHPVHKSAAVKRFVAEQNGRLKLFFSAAILAAFES